MFHVHYFACDKKTTVADYKGDLIASLEILLACNSFQELTKFCSTPSNYCWS